ncbi:hypothetical protein DFH11DRAFT_1690301 [Phellopilus nigrolimitatus]|nr:hypothetical protein DFH11DRAFT_1690301 [Phellopilus nigrolimitatus]
MDDPRSEIVNCVKELTLSPSPARQRAAVLTYFAPDAGFLHPLCTVPRGPGSRERILGIYEWYRDMSPNISAEVESSVYDGQRNVAYLDIVQSFHIFISPFKPKPARLLVKVTLERSQDDGKYYIIQQEDFYQPEDVLHLVLPFLAPPLVYVKHLAGRMCGVNAAAFGAARGLVHSGMAMVGSQSGHGGDTLRSKEDVDEHDHRE